ncbi:hypothetical protein EFM7_1372 [Enterococcus faecalis M7]|nr:hypothetical protein EFM7_1372 [Enterococcus faecalis M7]
MLITYLLTFSSCLFLLFRKNFLQFIGHIPQKSPFFLIFY